MVPFSCINGVTARSPVLVFRKRRHAPSGTISAIFARKIEEGLHGNDAFSGHVPVIQELQERKSNLAPDKVQIQDCIRRIVLILPVGAQSNAQCIRKWCLSLVS